MAELPSGTVTFLFTDVEGSTRLAEAAAGAIRRGTGRASPNPARRVRGARRTGDRHAGRRVLRRLLARRRTRLWQRLMHNAALAEHAWPDGVELRVRMGLHTGEPSVGDEGYHGLGVHRAARIMAAGHGGQVLVSQATCSVLEDDELPGIAIRDLGQHPLKDLDRPERIYQLDIEGLPVEFPPLRTAEAPTAYTGRVDELEEAARAAFWRGRLRTRRRLIAAIGAVLLAAGLIALPRRRSRRLQHCERALTGRCERRRGGRSRDRQRRGRSDGRCDAESLRRRRGCHLGHEHRRRHRLENRPGDEERRADDPGRQQPERDHDGRTARSGLPTASAARVSRIDPKTNTRRAGDRRRQRPGRHRLRGRLDLGREHGRRHDHEDRRRERQTGRRRSPWPLTSSPFGAGTLWASAASRRTAWCGSTRPPERGADDPCRERPSGLGVRRWLRLGGEQPRRDGLADRPEHDFGQSRHPGRETARSPSPSGPTASG